MKMVRSLLLGSAAGFVAVAGAQAADMPVKAKPVEYVKICTLYGAGFYYLPGTDICVKHGAYIRSQWYYGAGTAPTFGPYIGTSGQSSRLASAPNDLVHRTRATYTLDARTQTEYGTLRGYVLIGYTHETPGNSAFLGQGPALYATRAFIQFAGFTLGKATSFYDIWSVPANSYFAIPSSDTGDAGQMLWAYTFQFGNGFSATIAAEDPRRAVVHNVDIGPNFYTTVGVVPTGDQVSIQWPDLVANLRVDQAWGSFQIMGALHDNSAAYWGAFGGGPGVAGGGCFGTSLVGSLACGHPDDEIGFAVGAGGIFRIPMPGGLTDVASFQVNYAEGATRYVVTTQSGQAGLNLFSGSNNGFIPGGIGSLAIGQWTDGIFGNPGGLYAGEVQNTKALGVNASWDHRWSPNLKTSVYGFWVSMEHDSTAAALVCDTIPVTTGGAAAIGTNRLRVVSNCDPDFSWWGVGSRTQWNITPSFYVGFDVIYQRLETAFAGTGFYTGGVVRPAGFYTIEDQDAISGTVRAHWDILP